MDADLEILNVASRMADEASCTLHLESARLKCGLDVDYTALGDAIAILHAALMMLTGQQAEA